MDFVFVDTSAWYAYFDNSDTDHAAAVEFMNNSSSPLITSNYIVDETLTLFRTKVGHSQAVTIGKQFFAERLARLVRITERDEQTTFKLFSEYDDKNFSFTDCSSFVVMLRMGVNKVFTFDKHFQQMGFIKVP